MILLIIALLLIHCSIYFLPVATSFSPKLKTYLDHNTKLVFLWAGISFVALITLTFLNGTPFSITT